MISSVALQVAGVEYNEGMLEQAVGRLGTTASKPCHTVTTANHCRASWLVTPRHWPHVPWKQVNLVQGAAQDIAHPDESFDVITINQVIHHFDSADNYAALGATAPHL